MTPKSEKKAVFAGTFNPFTIGHADIVERSLAIFDSVVIALGFNEHKADSEVVMKQAQERAESIRSLYRDNPRVSVEVYSGLTAHFAHSIGASCLIRGLRSAADFDYEKPIADVNLKALGIDTLFLPCLPELTFVSSSMVRELQHNGFDASAYLPSLPDSKC